MPFQNATTIKALSDGATIDSDETLDNEVGTAISAACATAAAITTVRTEKAAVDLNAVIDGEKPVEIIQSGGNLTLDNVLKCISNNGFRVSFRCKKAGRIGGQDRVTLTIAWNAV